MKLCPVFYAKFLLGYITPYMIHFQPAFLTVSCPSSAPGILTFIFLSWAKLILTLGPLY